jgi:hypothetical protein
MPHRGAAAVRRAPGVTRPAGRAVPLMGLVPPAGGPRAPEPAAGGPASLASIISSRTEGYVEALAYLLIASFAVALRRAWSLLQGRHLPANQDG